MADGNLETSGVRLVADGADKYASDMDKIAKANEKAGKSISDLAGGAGGGNLDKITSGANSAASAVSGLAGAGEAAGSGVAAGAGAAVAAIGTIIAIAGAAVLAIAAIGNAVNNAIAYGSRISNIQDSSGLSGGLAQSLSGGADIGGTSARALVGTFNSIGDAAEKSGERADKALAKVGAAADKTGTRLQRLNDDYARSIADITTTAAQRIQDSNDNLVEAHAAMLEKQARADEDYARNVADGRASLAQRLSDIDASADTSIAGLTQRQTRATDDYARETENARRDLAQSILDIETNLATSVEQLQYNAAQQNTNAIESGAKAQEKIQEDLQKSLYDIEQKYSSKRQSLQEKIYDPNTNPILRAFYKTQLKSLDGLQKAEETGARAGASAKEAAARRETEALLAETARRLARETALEQAQAQQRIAAQQREAAQQQTERLRQFNQQSGDLAAQISRENAQRDQQKARAIADSAAREADLRRSYDRQTSDAQAAYDKQVLAAAAAQLKIQAETEKRLAAEKLQYDRAIEDINTSLANAGGGGASAAAVGIDKVARGFKTLGINADEFNKLPTDQKFKDINKSILDLVDSGNTDKAIQAIQDITGGSREMAAQYVNSVVDMRTADETLKTLGFTQEQIDQAKETEKQFNLVKLALSLLGAQIGAVFLPIVLDLIAGIKDLWKRFKEDLLPALKNTYDFIRYNLEVAFVTLKVKAAELWDKLEPVRKVIDSIANVAMAALDLKAREIAGFWNDVLGPAFKSVGDYLDKTFGPILNTLKDGILADLKLKFEGIKLVLSWLYDHLPNIATFFNNLATGIGRVQVPSYANSNNSAAANSFYGAGASQYNNGSVRSVPATGAQMAAGGKISTSNTTNSAVANVVVNVANGTKSAVSDGVMDGLFRAGFKVSK